MYEFMYIILCLIFWPLSNVLLVKLSRERGSLSLSFYRQLALFIVGLPIFLFLPLDFNIFIENISSILLAGVFGALGIFVNFKSFDFIQVVVSKSFAAISRSVLALIIGIFILKESLSFYQYLGSIIIFFGVILLNPKSINTINSNFFNKYLGIFLAILGGILIGLSFYFFKFYSFNFNPLVAAFILEVMNGVFLFFFYFFNKLYLKKKNHLSFNNFIRILLIVPLVYIGSASIVKALELIDFSIVNIALTGTMIFSMIFAWLLLGEKLTKKQIISIFIMLIGLILLKF